MQAPRPPVAPLRCGAAAAAGWASRGWQPAVRARRGALLRSHGRRPALGGRATSAAAAAAAMADPYGAATCVVHVTGLRLLADEACTDARGVAPAARVAEVLRAAAAKRPAVVVVTGDVAADGGSAAAYALAKRLLRAAFPAPTPILYLPGCGGNNTHAGASGSAAARRPR
jgi:3',5'-cyclic AMP phosphodiesterase CpdA